MATRFWFRPLLTTFFACLLLLVAVPGCSGDDKQAGSTAPVDAADDVDTGDITTTTAETTDTEEENEEPVTASGDDPRAIDGDLVPQAGGRLVFSVEADSDGYHPVQHRWAISGNFVASTFFESLMVENGDGTLEPWLAESMTANETSTEWTIVMRDGIVFHDGTPLTADVVANNILARKEGALTASANEAIEDAEVVDEHTVLVTMNEPWSAYDHSVAAVGGFIAAQAMLDDPSIDPIGTGPFEFESWVTGDNLLVSRYDAYWGDPAFLDEIEFQFITDVTTRRSALESDALDAMITGELSHITDFRDQDDGIVSYEHSSEPLHIMLNSAVAPFDDPLARDLLAAATDPEVVILAAGGEGLLQPATSPFVPSNPWHLEDNGWTGYDPDAAASLSQEWEDANGEPLSFSLKYTAGTQDDLAASLAQMYAPVGINLIATPTDQAALIGEVVFGDYESVLWRNHNWIDPDFNLIFWHSRNAAPPPELSINFTHLMNDELDAALLVGRSTTDEQTRRTAYDEVQRILNEEKTHIWLFDSVWSLATRDDIHGFADATDRGFSRLEPKVFWSDVWIEQ